MPGPAFCSCHAGLVVPMHCIHSSESKI
jgi:hypothetical protein